MAAFGTKVVVLMMVLPSLLLLQTASVQAVDILAYNENGPCSAAVGGGCYSIEAGVCCTMNGAAAVEVVGLLTGESATIYTGGGCTTEIAHVVGPNNAECYWEQAFSGVIWTYNN